MKRRFGIEIECAGLNVEQALNTLDYINVPVRRSVRNTHEVINAWKAVADGSIRSPNNRACEIVSPPLAPTKENFELVARVLDALREEGATVNDTCGFHVHVDLTDVEDGRYLLAMMTRYAHNEEKIDKFVNSNRRANNNDYCLSLKGRYTSDSFLIEHEPDFLRRNIFRNFSRYVKLNPCAFDRQKTIEFRHFHGTLDSKKATAWIKFCVNFVETSMQNIREFGKADVPEEVVTSAFQYAMQKADLSLSELEYAKTYFSFLVEDIKTKIFIAASNDNPYFVLNVQMADSEISDIANTVFININQQESPYRPIYKIFSEKLVYDVPREKEEFHKVFPRRIYTDPDKVNRYMSVIDSICNLDYVSKGSNAKAIRQLYWFYCFASYYKIYSESPYTARSVLETPSAWRYFFGTKPQKKLNLLQVLDTVAQDFGFKDVLDAGAHIQRNNEYKMLFAYRQILGRNVVAARNDNGFELKISKDATCLPLKFYLDVILHHYAKSVGVTPHNRGVMEEHVYKRNMINKHNEFYNKLVHQNEEKMNFDSNTIQFVLDNDLLVSKEPGVFEIAFGNRKTKQSYFSIFNQIFTAPEVTATLRSLDKNKSEVILNDKDKWFEIFDGLEEEAARELATL